MEAAEIGNDCKCKRTVWLSEIGWWNNEVKVVVRREEVLTANNEEAKERCMEAYRRKEKG